MSRNVMTKDVLLQVRLSRADRDRFQAECKRRGMVPSQVVRELLHGWFNGEDRTCAQREQAALKESQSERNGSESPQPENRHITGGEQEAVSPARRFDWQLPGYSWRKPCPTCGGQPSPASFCTTCVNNGYIFDFTS